MPTDFIDDFEDGEVIYASHVKQIFKPVHDLESGQAVYRTSSLGIDSHYEVDFTAAANPDGSSIAALTPGQLIVFKASHDSLAGKNLTVLTDSGQESYPLYIGGQPIAQGDIPQFQIVAAVYNDATSQGETLPPRFDVMGVGVSGVGSGGATSLDQLSDVSVTGATSGEVLQHDGTEFINRDLASAGISAVGHTHSINEVAALQTELNAKENTAYKGVAGGYAELDGTGKVPISQLPSSGMGADALSDLSDVNFPTSPANGEILQFDSTSGDFENRTPGSAGLVEQSRQVSTSAPITGGGNLSSDLTIAMPQANGSTDGYLSAVDHATFAGKQDQDAALDEIAALTMTKGDILVHDGTGVQKLTPGADGQVLSADSLATTGLAWSASGGGGASQLSDLSDVNFPTSPGNGEILQFDSTSGDFENRTPGSAGLVEQSRQVSTTAPITGGGNLSSDLTIAMPQANNSTDGYLSATDHATFAGKQDQDAALDEISTLSMTKGDIFVHNGSSISKLNSGSNGQVLQANSGTASGLEWATPSSSSPHLAHYQVYTWVGGSTMTISSTAWTNVYSGSFYVPSTSAVVSLNLNHVIEAVAGKPTNTGRWRVYLYKTGSSPVYLPNSTGNAMASPYSLTGLNSFGGSFGVTGLAAGTWALYLQMNADYSNSFGARSSRTSSNCTAFVFQA